MTGLLAGSFPELNLEALLSSYLAEGNDKIREDLAGTSLESDAIVRLKMAADAVSSAFQAMNNAAKGGSRRWIAIYLLCGPGKHL